MSDYRVLPCRRCGHMWKWAADKKSVPYCPDGYGCAEKQENNMDNPCRELWYEQRIKELESQLSKAMQIIEAYSADEGYVPKRVARLLEELETKGDNK